MDEQITTTHEHKHEHKQEQTQAVINRIAKIIGHLKSVKTMIEDNRDCSEVLIQLAAVKGAVNSTAKVILKDHLEHCIVHAIEDNDTAALEELEKAIDQLIK